VVVTSSIYAHAFEADDDAAALQVAEAFDASRLSVVA
jgi:hypothetical protein